MSLTVEALKKLYVKLGGDLQKAYPGIAGGVPVKCYTLIPDMINALEQVAESGGGGTSSFIIYDVADVNLVYSDSLHSLRVKDTLQDTDGRFAAALEKALADGLTIKLSMSSNVDLVVANVISISTDLTGGSAWWNVAYVLPYEINGSYVQKFVVNASM